MASPHGPVLADDILRISFLYHFESQSTDVSTGIMLLRSHLPGRLLNFANYRDIIVLDNNIPITYLKILIKSRWIQIGQKAL